MCGDVFVERGAGAQRREGERVSERGEKERKGGREGGRGGEGGAESAHSPQVRFGVHVSSLGK